MGRNINYSKFTIQSIDSATQAINQDDLLLAKDQINAETNQNGETIVYDIQSDISTQTTVINSNTSDVATNTINPYTNTTATDVINPNTTTQVSTLKPTFYVASGVITYGSAYQTILNVSGQGIYKGTIFNATATASGGSTLTGIGAGLKITVDGMVLLIKTKALPGTAGTGFNVAYRVVFGNTDTSNSYYIDALDASGNPADYEITLNFKTSLKIEVYYDVSNYLTRSNGYKLIYSLYQ